MERGCVKFQIQTFVAQCNHDLLSNEHFLPFFIVLRKFAVILEIRFNSAEAKLYSFRTIQGVTKKRH